MNSFKKPTQSQLWLCHSQFCRKKLKLRGRRASGCLNTVSCKNVVSPQIYSDIFYRCIKIKEKGLIEGKWHTQNCREVFESQDALPNGPQVAKGTWLICKQTTNCEKAYIYHVTTLSEFLELKKLKVCSLCKTPQRRYIPHIPVHMPFSSAQFFR